MLLQLDALFKSVFQAIVQQANQPVKKNILGMVGLSVLLFFKLVLPFLVVASLVGTLIEFMQVGAIFSVKKIKPDLKKLNPIEGMKKIVAIKKLGGIA
jgi:flagellar biosynthesis protein FlhB